MFLNAGECGSVLSLSVFQVGMFLETGACVLFTPSLQ